MTTIINNPGTGDEGDGPAIGVIIGILLALIVGGILLFYFLPELRGTKEPDTTTTEIKIELPVTPTPKTNP